MPLKRLLVSMASVAAFGFIAFAYNNCAQTDFAFEEKQGLITDEDLKERLDEINKRCDNTTHQTQNFSFTFPNPNVTCPWNTNGNLAIRNGYFQGRIEQAKAFTLPAGSTLCDLDFNFTVQQFRFDDMFILTLNRKVLASSYNYSPKFQKFGPLDHYDWASIVGMEWVTSQEGIFCQGLGTSGTTCQWPQTDTPGAISMEFPAATIRTIMAVDPASSNHTFEIISIGDNDDLDCEHSDITFTVNASYVP
ncbi:MAG: hypothetical protein ABL958_01235 [Bdellovibrionia bacterium]